MHWYIKKYKGEVEYEKKNLKRYSYDLKKLLQDKKKNCDFNKIINDFLSLKKPNKLLIVKLIDKISLSENGTINIYYKIKCPY